MTGLLVFIIVILVVLALALYAVTLLPFLDPMIRGCIQALLVVVAIIVICNRAGVF